MVTVKGAMGSSGKDSGLPERAVGLLLSRLKAHKLWDALLISLPPLAALAYLATFLQPSDPAPERGLAALAMVVVGLFLALAFWRLRPQSPSAPHAARLIDQRVEGKERFVTLATLEPSLGPSFLVERLRQEAAALLHRLDVKKDFPYRPKRSFFASATGSLVILLLFLLALEILPLFRPQQPSASDLALLARRLSQEPRLAEIARSLAALAARLKEPSLSEQEKRALVQELLKKIEEQMGAEKRQGGSGSEPLNQAADALRQLGKSGERKEEQKGGGELKTNLPEQGQGKEKNSGQGTGGEAKDASVMGSKEPREGKSAQGQRREGKDQGEQKGPGKGEGSKREGEQKRDLQGATQAGEAGEGGKQGEEIPRGSTPDRFAKLGEKGAGVIKGARFVTVELPEQEAEGSTGKGSTKERKARPAAPVSNTPLRRPDSPDLAPEKQPLPLEYRGLIR